jgi:hypothetical protein
MRLYDAKQVDHAEEVCRADLFEQIHQNGLGHDQGHGDRRPVSEGRAVGRSNSDTTR